MQFDVVAVGGGFAGMIVANRCAQLGLRAVVLEKDKAARYLCNSRITMDRLHGRPVQRVHFRAPCGGGDRRCGRKIAAVLKFTALTEGRYAAVGARENC